MKNHIIISIIIGAIILSCILSNSKKESADSSNVKILTIDTLDKGESIVISKSDNYHYSFIVGVVNRDDTTFIDADYIQYLTGNAAIEAAKKAHQADTFKTADGKTHVSVPNDYFILNENEKIKRLALDKYCSINLVINLDSNPPISDNSLESLKKRIEQGAPFILTLNNSGVVIKIKEVFIP